MPLALLTVAYKPYSSLGGLQVEAACSSRAQEHTRRLGGWRKGEDSPVCCLLWCVEQSRYHVVRRAVCLLWCSKKEQRNEPIMYRSEIGILTISKRKLIVL